MATLCAVCIWLITCFAFRARGYYFGCKVELTAAQYGIAPPGPLPHPQVSHGPPPQVSTSSGLTLCSLPHPQVSHSAHTQISTSKGLTPTNNVLKKLSSPRTDQYEYVYCIGYQNFIMRMVMTGFCKYIFIHIFLACLIMYSTRKIFHRSTEM